MFQSTFARAADSSDSESEVEINTDDMAVEANGFGTAVKLNNTDRLKKSQVAPAATPSRPSERIHMICLLFITV